MLNVTYRKRIIDHVMLNIKQLPSLQTRRSVNWKASFQKLFQSMRIDVVSIASVSAKTNQNHVHFQRNLKRNLHEPQTHAFTHQLIG